MVESTPWGGLSEAISPLLGGAFLAKKTRICENETLSY